MKKVITFSLLIASFLLHLNAEEVFENDYFKMTLPEGMVKYELPTDKKSSSDKFDRYRNGTNQFVIRTMESKLSASQFVYDMEKAFKQMGEIVQSRYFNVNGYVLPGLVEVEKHGDTTLGHVHIVLDNGRHKLEEAGNAYLFHFEMIYRLEDEMQQHPKNEKSLQTLTFKRATFDVSYDLNRTKEFSLTAPAPSFLYYSSYSPVLITPSQTILFSDIKPGVYAESNPAFSDFLKIRFKEFKKLNPKDAVMEEMTIDGHKAAMFKGTTEDKKEKYCSTSFNYFIEVSPKLIRKISYDMNCEYVSIKQPVILPIVKSFIEHKNKK